MASPYILAGLGNPGSQYALTRHNIGFMILDFLAGRFDAGFKAGRGDYVYARLQVGQSKVYLVKPLTYMNLSGYGVRQAMNYWRIPICNLLVVYDDFHLPFGKIRFRASGSDGGHNGMGSLIQVLMTEDIARLRVGIGQEKFTGDSVRFVLANFSRKEQKFLPQLLELSSDALELFILHGIEKAMNQFNNQSLF